MISGACACTGECRKPGGRCPASGQQIYGQYSFTPNNDSGWVCPKCHNVYGPMTPECFKCNNQSGKIPNPDHRFTIHDGNKCGICGEETWTTEPRDFGHLKSGWDKEKP